MNLQERIDILARLGDYMRTPSPEWEEACLKAERQNGWFIQPFINLAVRQISTQYLQADILENWATSYRLPAENPKPLKVGIVMAGNIPLVGLHDWLSVFITGHIAAIKPSSKDEVLIRHLLGKMAEWAPISTEFNEFREMLQGCDAYIATGSNNSAGYFDYYFGKYPHIIRRNRTSVAILDGQETPDDLSLLADDIMSYFGLGCRNITKLMVPREYDFVPLIGALKKYDHLADHNKNKNNYDYNLAIQILNNQFYMSTPAILLVENKSIFSPISQLNYEYYESRELAVGGISGREDIQCIVGRDFLPFGQAQFPAINDYADGVDTLSFLTKL